MGLGFADIENNLTCVIEFCVSFLLRKSYVAICLVICNALIDLMCVFNVFETFIFWGGQIHTVKVKKEMLFLIK